MVIGVRDSGGMRWRSGIDIVSCGSNGESRRAAMKHRRSAHGNGQSRVLMQRQSTEEKIKDTQMNMSTTSMCTLLPATPVVATLISFCYGFSPSPYMFGDAANVHNAVLVCCRLLEPSNSLGFFPLCLIKIECVES
jgi:hypothetical protein